MDRCTAIHNLLKVMAFEVLEFIKEAERSFQNQWVPAVHIKDVLRLNLNAYPLEGEQHGPKGWLFSILARMLQDEGLLEYMGNESRVFYRSKKA